ncbi:MAG: helix-turn-helix transcriptional regulator [Bacilli bacterium]|nr:helix-turn-helix transcriptional regulator [Bacilli bacterium]
MKFNERLKLYRKRAGLSQEQFASALNVKQYNVSDYEVGRSEPSIELLIKIAQVLNISIDELVGNDNAPLSVEGKEKILLETIERLPDEDKSKAVDFAIEVINYVGNKK